MRVLYKSPEFKKLHDEMGNRHRTDPRDGNSIHFAPVSPGLDLVPPEEPAVMEALISNLQVCRVSGAEI
jgi:hypothetical protein